MDLKHILLCLLLLAMPPISHSDTQTNSEQLQQQIIQRQQQRQQDLRDRIEQQQNQHQSIDLQPSPHT